MNTVFVTGGAGWSGAAVESSYRPQYRTQIGINATVAATQIEFHCHSNVFLEAS